MTFRPVLSSVYTFETTVRSSEIASSIYGRARRFISPSSRCGYVIRTLPSRSAIKTPSVKMECSKADRSALNSYSHCSSLRSMMPGSERSCRRATLRFMMLSMFLPASSASITWASMALVNTFLNVKIADNADAYQHHTDGNHDQKKYSFLHTSSAVTSLVWEPHRR